MCSRVSVFFLNEEKEIIEDEEGGRRDARGDEEGIKGVSPSLGRPQ